MHSTAENASLAGRGQSSAKVHRCQRSTLDLPVPVCQNSRRSAATSRSAALPRRYRPAAVRCSLHVAFHGCQQGREVLRELYATRTGYNRWADTNGLVILYPQAVRTPANPRDCWGLVRL